MTCDLWHDLTIQRNFPPKRLALFWKGPWIFVSIPWYISYHQTSRGDYRCHSIMTENMIPRKMGSLKQCKTARLRLQCQRQSDATTAWAAMRKIRDTRMINEAIFNIWTMYDVFLLIHILTHLHSMSKSRHQPKSDSHRAKRCPNRYNSKDRQQPQRYH